MAALVSNSDVTLDDGYRLPDIKTLQNAIKLSIVEDRPIMMDYWTNSIDKSVMIGIREDGKKMLIKSAEEYTSYIEKVYRINGKDYIILTENSIYIVDTGIPNKRVSYDA
jgi:D-aminopeptidase